MHENAMLLFILFIKEQCALLAYLGQNKYRRKKDSEGMLDQKEKSLSLHVSSSAVDTDPLGPVSFPYYESTFEKN